MATYITHTLPLVCDPSIHPGLIPFCSGKSVVLTLWNSAASDPRLDGAIGTLLLVTSVRVTDYNGCSLSSVTRSRVEFNPQGVKGEWKSDLEGKGEWESDLSDI
jgi:hypothetical protein